MHLLKNIRNNLLKNKKSVFPEFSFSCLQKTAASKEGYIAWGDLEKIYNQDCSLYAHLRKAYKLTMSAFYPYRNKQNVNLALTIFDERTIVAAKCYYIFERSDFCLSDFCLSKQTFGALITTLRSQAALIKGLLNKNYHYVLPARFQSYQLEKRICQYRQMSGGNFLVCLKEVQDTEKTLICQSLLKEQIDLWEKGLSSKVDITPQMMDILKEKVEGVDAD